MPGRSDFTDERQRRRGLLYGRRKGPKLSAHQASLFQTLLPSLELKLEPGRDPREYFGAPVEEVWLEIGFGAGEHLLWQAAQHPNIGLIGCEPYEAGMAKLLAKLAAPVSRQQSLDTSAAASGRKVKEAARTFSSPTSEGEVSSSAQALRGGGGLVGINLRLYGGDAREVIDALPDASLARVFLLFPDPWPKKRHHKRRFIQTEALDALARVMKQGAELRFASDDADYVAWTLERVLAHDGFEWNASCANDWRVRPADWPATRYEQKALHGQPVFLKFVRRDEMQKILSSPNLS